MARVYSALEWRIASYNVREAGLRRDAPAGVRELHVAVPASPLPSLHVAVPASPLPSLDDAVAASPLPSTRAVAVRRAVVREDLAGVQDAVRVERVFEPALQCDEFTRLFERQIRRLEDTDTMFTR